MIRHIGSLVILTGVAHALVGSLVFAQPLGEILEQGLFDTVAAHDARKAAFWFMVLTPPLLGLGLTLRHAVACNDRHYLAISGWTLLGVGVLGAIAMPVSGFWLVIGLSIPILLQVRRGELQADQVE